MLAVTVLVVQQWQMYPRCSPFLEIESNVVTVIDSEHFCDFGNSVLLATYLTHIPGPLVFPEKISSTHLTKQLSPSTKPAVDNTLGLAISHHKSSATIRFLLA